ncbi:MAG: hypothetical protein H0V17_25445 [Deltaproteobacteria bacterium]|nr:hypothetical protein [Deltaproteobacteria bacterium]
MRWVGVAVTAMMAACGAGAEPDELEIHITTGAIARDQLSQVNVIVEPPRGSLVRAPKAA